MKKVLFCLLLVTNLAHADWRDPYEPIDTSKNFTNESTIVWTPVDNINKSCSEERQRRGFPDHNQPVQACSFWDGKTCLILTKRSPTRETLGHEFQHCFQGKWH
jgi:hypothetical protein